MGWREGVDSGERQIEAIRMNPTTEMLIIATWSTDAPKARRLLARKRSRRRYLVFAIAANMLAVAAAVALILVR